MRREVIHLPVELKTNNIRKLCDRPIYFKIFKNLCSEENVLKIPGIRPSVFVL